MDSDFPWRNKESRFQARFQIVRKLRIDYASTLRVFPEKILRERIAYAKWHLAWRAGWIFVRLKSAFCVDVVAHIFRS